MSDHVIVDVNNKPIGNLRKDPPKKNTPDREFLRVLRMVETARRTDLADLCGQLQEAAKAGWSMTISKELPEYKAVITQIMHIGRDANNCLEYKPERWLRLGSGYEEALNLLIEENERVKKNAN